MPNGFVSLVGSGPGDPGLITVKGMRRLREADVVIFDRLAAPELISNVSAEVELIDAGKQPGNPGLGQEEINRLLIEKARAGKRVVRLKGGDPFVFGRGGEEALACARAGIRFEVVPGVTSGIAAPAYAGIPVTHRGVSTSVTLVTGHEENSRDAVIWGELARTHGTLVLMMSVASLPEISAALIEGGLGPATPAAAIEWGTRPSQRVIIASLGDLPERATEARLRAPAAIVVGDVVSLRAEIGWLERQPLWGRTILVTRAREQASQLAMILADLGAEVVTFPLIAIESAEDTRPLLDALERLGGGGFSWVVFTSANGVERASSAMAEVGLDSRAFAGVKVAAIGPATADALGRIGITADLIADVASSEGLLDTFPKDGRGEQVLLIRAETGREVLPRGLRERGFDLEEVAAYRTVIVDDGADDLKSKIAEGEIDLVTFTSSSTVRHFVDLIGTNHLPEIVACIGPATARTARDLGITPTLVAEEHTIDGLVEALIDHLGGC